MRAPEREARRSLEASGNMTLAAHPRSRRDGRRLRSRSARSPTRSKSLDISMRFQ
ncbi:MAG: hypothetical protein MZU97_11815 [Bacillus subtilis]|nr:hypothetical protein [Bacillus subtilis]